MEARRDGDTEGVSKAEGEREAKRNSYIHTVIDSEYMSYQ